MELHLDSLYISGFRGIPKLEIPRLGRVTLLAGKNGVGKTAVLNAVQAYAARCRYEAMAAVLRNRRELRLVTDDDGRETLVPNWNNLFYGRDMWLASGINIGPDTLNRQMSLRTDWAEIPMTGSSFRHDNLNREILALSVTYGEQHWSVPIDEHMSRLSMPPRRFRHSAADIPPAIGCELLGPGLPSDRELARFWDDVVIRGEQPFAVDTLNLLLYAPAEWIAVVGDAQASRQGRRVIVKVDGETAPVPLQSLGDGAARLFGVALALVNSRDGFLLIDEAENGIHHSIQQNLWNLVLLTAEQYNVQVLATTHSRDCVVGFAKAVNNLPDIEGVLYRIQRNGQRLRAVEYPESELMIAVNHDIEVR